MRNSTESPRGLSPVQSALPGSASVNAAQEVTGQAALAVVESAEQEDGSLPTEVQAEVEVLIAALLQEAGADHDRGFRSSAEYRQRSVRAGALLREYLGHSAPLHERAGVPSTTLQKYAERDGLSFLTSEETHAIQELSRELEGFGKAARIGEEEGKKMLALVRLLRKGKMDEQLQTFRQKEGISSSRLNRQLAKYRGVTTQSLVPAYFPEPAAAEADAVAREVLPQDDATPIAEEVIPAADGTSTTHVESPAALSTPVAAAAAEDVAPAAASSETSLSSVQLGIVDRLTAQNDTIVTAMQGMEASDARLAVLHTLIEQNRAILHTLGISPAAPSLPAIALSSVPTVPANTVLEEPTVKYRTSDGAELVISSTQRGIVLILEGKPKSGSDTPAVSQ